MGFVWPVLITLVAGNWVASFAWPTSVNSSLDLGMHKKWKITVFIVVMMIKSKKIVHFKSICMDTLNGVMNKNVNFKCTFCKLKKSVTLRT